MNIKKAVEILDGYLLSKVFKFTLPLVSEAWQTVKEHLSENKRLKEVLENIQENNILVTGKRVEWIDKALTKEHLSDEPEIETRPIEKERFGVDHIRGNEPTEEMYKCVNCGNGCDCIIIMKEDDGEEDINNIFTCKYEAKFVKEPTEEKVTNDDTLMIDIALQNNKYAMKIWEKIKRVEIFNQPKEPTVHKHDCAKAINGRHDCSCQDDKPDLIETYLKDDIVTVFREIENVLKNHSKRITELEKG